MFSVNKKILLPAALACSLYTAAQQTNTGNDVNTPLHLLQPAYRVPYGKTDSSAVKQVLDKIWQYLDAATPVQLVNRTTAQPLQPTDAFTPDAICKPGDFRLVSYEWGVTYSGMLLAGEQTGDPRFTRYTTDRLGFIAAATGYFRAYQQSHPDAQTPVRSVLQPKALDDAGAMCMAMIKDLRLQHQEQLRPLINGYIDYILHKEFRLSDGTLARNRPLPRTLWLDDLFMSVPALAQMGALTGDVLYFDEAVKQVNQFAQRMFVPEKKLYRHGWVEDMNPHPAFHWARANGWAILAKTELLDALPASHSGREALLQLLRRHIEGLAALQSGDGFWHQLLDRNDTYTETSATAIYTYCIAHAINQGWIDAKAYGPVALLGWNAVSTRVNNKGQVEGTCVGTGMGFDPAFYAYRPVNVYAAHGYGPVLLAGAEMIRLLRLHPFHINDSAVQFAQ